MMSAQTAYKISSELRILCRQHFGQYLVSLDDVACGHLGASSAYSLGGGTVCRCFIPSCGPPSPTSSASYRPTSSRRRTATVTPSV